MMDSLKPVLDKYGLLPFLFAGVIFLTIPPILIHFATRSSSESRVNTPQSPPTAPHPTPPPPPNPKQQGNPNPGTKGTAETPGSESIATTIRERTVQVNRKLESWDARVTLTLDTIVLLPNEYKMRWNFSVFNQSGQPQVIGGTQDSYVTDNAGNTLKFLNKSSANSFTQDVPSGQKNVYWFDFESPEKTPTTLTAHFSKNPYQGTRVGGSSGGLSGSLPSTITVSIP